MRPSEDSNICKWLGGFCLVRESCCSASEGRAGLKPSPHPVTPQSVCEISCDLCSLRAPRKPCRGSWGKNSVYDGAASFFPLSLCGHLHWWCKSGGKCFGTNHDCGTKLSWQSCCSSLPPTRIQKLSPFSSVLEEAVRIIKFIKFWPMSACLFNILWDGIESLRDVLLQVEVQWLFRGKALVLFGGWDLN